MSTVANYDTSITFHGSTIPTILIAYNTGFFFQVTVKNKPTPPQPHDQTIFIALLRGGIQLKKEYLFWTVEDVGQQVILIWGWHWFFVFTYLTFRWPKDFFNVEIFTDYLNAKKSQKYSVSHLLIFIDFDSKKPMGWTSCSTPLPVLLRQNMSNCFFAQKLMVSYSELCSYGV